MESIKQIGVPGSAEIIFMTDEAQVTGLHPLAVRDRAVMDREEQSQMQMLRVRLIPRTDGSRAWLVMSRSVSKVAAQDLIPFLVCANHF
jgi:hypothetical protein